MKEQGASFEFNTNDPELTPNNNVNPDQIITGSGGTIPDGIILQGGNTEGSPLVIGTLDGNSISLISNSTEVANLSDINISLLSSGTSFYINPSGIGGNAFTFNNNYSGDIGNVVRWDEFSYGSLGPNNEISWGEVGVDILGVQNITSPLESSISITCNTPESVDSTGNGIYLAASAGNDSGGGGVIELLAGNGGITGDGGNIILDAGAGGSTSGDGGDVVLTAGLGEVNGKIVLNSDTLLLAPARILFDPDGVTNLDAGIATLYGVYSSENQNLTLQAGASTTADTSGNSITMTGSDGNGDAGGGGIELVAGNGGTGINPQNGGDIQITAGNGVNGGDSGRILLYNQTEIYNGDLIINNSAKGIVLVDTVTAVTNRITLVDGVLTITPI